MDSRYEEFMKTQPYLPFNMEGRLTEAMIAKARKELGETEEVKAKTIPQLRQLILAESGLICPTDDAWLLQFLRARKFNVKNAFTVMKNFYLVTKSHKDVYGTFNPEALRRAMSQKAGFALFYRDEQGCAIGLMKMRNWDVDVVSAPEAMTAMTCGVRMLAQEPATQICGFKLLLDVQGASLKQIRSLIPGHALMVAKGLNNCQPIRIKGIHVINESPIFQYLFSFFKLFLSEKIRNRIHLHGYSLESLHKYIPKAILPTDYGGDNPNDDAALYNTELEKYFETYRRITTTGYRH